MNPLFDKPFTFDRVARILFGLAVISGIIYLIAVLRNALLPFLIAWLLAYMMQPFVKFFQYKVKLKSRLLSILAVLVSTLLVISLVGVVIVPSVTQEFNRTLELMQEHNSGYGHIPMIPQSWAEYLEKNIDPDQLAQLLSKENIEKAVKQIAPKMWIVLTNTFSILFSITIVFVIFLYFIFILLDYERIVNGWIRLIPERYRPFVQGLADDVEYSMNRYFRGQSLIALCVGILFAIGFKIVGFPLAVILGLFIGFLNLIPYANDRYHPDDLAESPQSCGDRRKLLADLRIGNSRPLHRAVHTRLVSHSPHYGKGYGTESGHHPSFFIHLGNFIRFYRLNHRSPPDNSLSLLL